MSEDLNQLVASAQGGQPGALDALLTEVRRAVLRYAMAQRMSREDADDLAQDVCIAVLRVVPEWQETGRSAWGFVFAVARNKLADGVRRQTRRGALGRAISLDADDGGPAIDVADAAPGPEDHVLRHAASSEMAQLLQMLPTTQREVLLLRAVVGLSGAETAEILGLAQGSVHVLQHRAVTRLRALLAADPELVSR